MARFDVFSNAGKLAKTTPYLLDVQSDLLDALDTRVVIPLRSVKHFPNVSLPEQLMPVFQILGKDYLLETPKMAAIPKSELKKAPTLRLRLAAPRGGRFYLGAARR